MKDLLEAVLYIRSNPRLYNEDQKSFCQKSRRDLKPRMIMLARAITNLTDRPKCYTRTMTVRVQLKKKVREPQEAWRQDELIGGKPLVVK
jgi:hypothetical protein